jgi:hypothetical protein
MKPLPTIQEIEKCKTSPWDFGNGVLYDLCKANFFHQDTDKILSKVWLIGRTYSAAIERRRNKVTINDNFYIGKVVPAFKISMIDSFLVDLKKHNELTIDNLPLILNAHNYLTRLTASITDLEKRSFSSKYLHFHLPNLFFIYDSRVVSSLRQFIDRVPKSMDYLLESDSIDNEYAKFVCKCFIVRSKIKDKYQIELTTRQFDNILIELANKKLDEKNDK